MSDLEAIETPIFTFDRSGQGGWLLDYLTEDRKRMACRLASLERLVGSPLDEGLEEIEFTILSDEEIGEVHETFMGISGATDVITFAHGEIVIGVGTLKEYAKEFDEPLEREGLRYLVHGLLHLGGYEDDEEEKRDRMHAVQEKIVAQIFENFPL